MDININEKFVYHCCSVPSHLNTTHLHHTYKPGFQFQPVPPQHLVVLIKIDNLHSLKSEFSLFLSLLYLPLYWCSICFCSFAICSYFCKNRRHFIHEINMVLYHTTYLGVFLTQTKLFGGENMKLTVCETLPVHHKKTLAILVLKSCLSLVVILI